VSKAAKRVPRSTSYWGRLRDDELLKAEVTVDDPESLEGLVYEVPAGEEESYVESSYDFRGTDREELSCVHGSHGHLAGFVMRKGTVRFLVGHICAKNIYGEHFEAHKNDYEAAVQRRDILRRVQEVGVVIDPFLRWLGEASQMSAFEQYEAFKSQLADRMPWLHRELNWHTNNRSGWFGRANLPPTLFDGFTDPHKAFKMAAAEMSGTLMLAVAKMKIEKDVESTFSKMRILLTKLDTALVQLQEVVDFLQPELLSQVCQHANERDNAKKRKYIPGLMSITCQRDKGMATVQLARNYTVSSRGPIVGFRAAMNGFA
jgi:hypothetical protein